MERNSEGSKNEFEEKRDRIQDRLQTLLNHADIECTVSFIVWKIECPDRIFTNKCTGIASSSNRASRSTHRYEKHAQSLSG